MYKKKNSYLFKIHTHTTSFGVTFIQTTTETNVRFLSFQESLILKKYSFLSSWIRRYLHDLNFIPANMNKSFKNVDMLWGDCISQTGVRRPVLRTQPHGGGLHWPRSTDTGGRLVWALASHFLPVWPVYISVYQLTI